MIYLPVKLNSVYRECSFPSESHCTFSVQLTEKSCIMQLPMTRMMFGLSELLFKPVDVVCAFAVPHIHAADWLAFLSWF